MQQKIIKNFDIPNKKIETWKFTDLKKYFEKNDFKPKTNSFKKSNVINSNIPKNIFFNPNKNFIIIENGILKKINIKSENLEIKSSKNIFKKKNIKNFLRKDSLLDINETFLNENIIITIKKNTKLNKTITIFYYNSENEKNIINNKINIFLEENAEAEISEIFFSKEKSFYWNNVHKYIDLKKNSKLNHYNIQLESKNALHSSINNVNCNSASTYDSFIFSTGANLSRIEAISSINAEDINFNIKGLYLANKNQHHDITTLMQHKKPNSKSNQHIKGILEENSSGVFQGKVIVSQDAQKTDAFQFNQNLLLSENADVNSKPELEIYADDVKCSHGSTTGDLDEEMLFYLRSRGLNKQQAKKILIEGFINELFDEIKNEEIKENLLKTSKEII